MQPPAFFLAVLKWRLVAARLSGVLVPLVRNSSASRVAGDPRATGCRVALGAARAGRHRGALGRHASGHAGRTGWFDIFSFGDHLSLTAAVPVVTTAWLGTSVVDMAQATTATKPFAVQVAQELARMPVVAISIRLETRAGIPTRITVGGRRTEPFTPVDTAAAMAVQHTSAPGVNGVQRARWVAGRFTAINALAAIRSVAHRIVAGVARIGPHRATTTGHEGRHHGNR